MLATRNPPEVQSRHATTSKYRMPRNDPTLLPVLRAIAAEHTPLAAGQLDEDQVELAVTFGLGSLLRTAAGGDLSVFPSRSRPLIVGSELEAESSRAEMESALCQILDESQAHVGLITLLKGISVSEYYPVPHMRWMGDLDLLVDVHELADFERVLRSLGYRPHQSDIPDDFYRDHHHSRPYVHPDSGVRVEAHTSLLPPRFGIGRSSALGNDNVEVQRTVSTFAGREVLRFNKELQLLYIAAHWLYDLNVSLGLAATGLIDTLYILRDRRHQPDWKLVCSWLVNREVATPLFVLFGYLRRYGLIEPDGRFTSMLSRAPKSVGPLGVRAMYQIVDTCLDGGFEGRLATPENAAIVWRTLASPTPPLRNFIDVPFNLAFPPDHPGRFTLKFHIGRARSLFRYRSLS